EPHGAARPPRRGHRWRRARRPRAPHPRSDPSLPPGSRRELARRREARPFESRNGGRFTMNAKTLPFGLVLLAILPPACIVTTWAMDGEASPVDGEEPSAAPAPSVEVPLAAPSGEVVPSEAGERIVLRSGFKLEGRIVKRTETMLFLDVGYTILSVPGDEVRRIEPIVAAEESASESGVRSESDSIFYTADGLRSGPIDQKAREVAESV